MAKRLLVNGTPLSLCARYGAYEVHFTRRKQDEIANAQKLMAKIPGSRMADDVATRFQVPIDNQLNLARLFNILSSEGEFSEYTVEKSTLECVFLTVIKDNNVAEEDVERNRPGYND